MDIFILTSEWWPLNASPQQQNTRNTIINLKGIDIGNGWIDDAIALTATYKNLWTRTKSAKEFSLTVHNYDPCTDHFVEAYLHFREVQTALHAKPANWTGCTPITVLPIIENLTASGITVWICNGDLDGLLPVATSRTQLTPSIFLSRFLGIHGSPTMRPEGTWRHTEDWHELQRGKLDIFSKFQGTNQNEHSL